MACATVVYGAVLRPSPASPQAARWRFAARSGSVGVCLRRRPLPQPFWHIKDDYYTYLQLPYLGLPRADEEYPMRSFFKAGVTVASASDFPVTVPPDPLVAIAVGVTRWMPEYAWEYPAPPSLDGVLWPEERVSVKQMIRSFTIEGAKANFLEKRIGSIEVASARTSWCWTRTCSR